MLSVVVPIYNMENYLDRCMSTLLHQTRKPWEILLVDDGSTDGSAQLCDAYCQQYSFVKTIHKKNGGLSSARNAGIECASGQFITFPDPDDWTESDYFEKFTSLAETYDADMVCTGYYIDYDNSNRAANPGAATRIMNRVEALRALLMHPRMDGFAWNKIFRLDIIRSHQLRFIDSMGTTEDLAFTYKYLQHCDQILFSPGTRTYHYYQRMGAATSSIYSPKKLNSLKIFECMIRDHLDDQLVEAAKIQFCDMSLNLLCSLPIGSQQDQEAEQRLLCGIKKYRNVYICSKNVKARRKAQMVCALVSPKMYHFLKAKLAGENRQ